MIFSPEIAAENARRNAMLDAPYDPVSGLHGCAGARAPFEFVCGRKKIVWGVPVAMLKDPLVAHCKKIRLLAKVVKNTPLLQEQVRDELKRIRMRYDFEFWAATCAKIKHKTTADVMDFILNVPQRKLLKVIVGQREAGKPMRIILCKARQWGGSTLVQIFTQWMQTFVHQRWNSAIVTLQDDQTRNIREMFDFVALRHPADMGTITLKNFQGSQKNKRVIESDSIIYMGSMEKPDSIRSGDFKMAHLSEVGLWKETKGKRPKDVIQTVTGSLSYEPDTMIVQESTAKGVGNYFHSAWLEAVAGKSNYTAVFVSWFEIPRCRKPLGEAPETFCRSLSDYERRLWLLGATLEGIMWYRDAFKEVHGDTWIMNSEYPSTANEAFQSKGTRVFPPDIVAAAEQYLREPLKVGELVAAASKGRDALKDIQFFPQVGGNLKIWIEPTPLNGVKMRNRFCGFLDPARGTTEAADYGVLTIIDRAPLLQGLPCEVAARWRGHIDQDLLAWISARICMWYDKCLLAVEMNAIRRTHGETILNEIKDEYDNLYYKQSIEDIELGKPRQYGFWTNDNKTAMIDELKGRLRDGQFIERDGEAFFELHSYEHKPDGTMGNAEGCHDDIVMSDAGALFVAKDMDAVALIVPDNPSAGRRNVYGEASM
jgi:hypothetical protein